jgi:hypothetical protein
MAQQQQTVLRVQTNIPSGIEFTGTTVLTAATVSGMTFTGSGTQTLPYTGTTTGTSWSFTSTVTGGTGIFYYNINMPAYAGSSIDLYSNYKIELKVTRPDGSINGMGGFIEYGVPQMNRNFKVDDGDTITITAGTSIPTGGTVNFYVIPDNTTNFGSVISYDTLDLYNDIPIKLNKSFAELQDISKRNSDFSLGLALPGSKKNNAFFENYFNVDTLSLYFDVTRRVNIDVLLNDEKYFSGYMRLNKVSVLNSKIEYDVTLYSTVADLYGKMGNNLLKDLDYSDKDWHFNHFFNVYNVSSTWNYNTILSGDIVPSLWMYPIVHNGYLYSGTTANVSGGTIDSQTRLYTSTIVSGFTNNAAFLSAGGEEFRINSPVNPILDNQLKPALNIYALIQLMFKNYGYKIKSTFFESPWFKLLYMYGFYSSDGTKFGYKTPETQVLPLEGVDVLLVETFEDFSEFPCGPQYIRTVRTYDIYVVKKGTGISALCSEQIDVALDFELQPCSGPNSLYTINLVIPPKTTKIDYSWTSNQFVDCGFGCPFQLEIIYNYGFNASQSNVGLSSSPLTYLPGPSNVNVNFTENTPVDFSLVIDTNIKQIDILSSIAKKFNLVIIPDPEVPNQMIIEPYDFYVGSGAIYDWTDKLSFDKGFTVQPALNFIESELILTDQEDGDEANKTFKDRNKLVYGENRVYNPTDFKSQTKRIDTIFAPEVIRKWDDRVGIPLGVNYAAQSKPEASGGSEIIRWNYTGLKQKPRLMFNNGNFSPFLDEVGESYNFSGTSVNTMMFRIQPSDGVNPAGSTQALASLVNPVISHTMPMGNEDDNRFDRLTNEKFNNDSICILFNSEKADDIGLGIPTFNTFTENDAYNLFYFNRIDNLYNKNTRFLTGKFNLKLNDVKTLEPRDLIKVQEQYFLVNKLDGFDLTNPELTNVELIQTNARVRPQPYPTRYFKYRYCNEQNDNTYMFRTYFNPEENNNGLLYTANNESVYSVRRTYFYWSLFYDYMVGALGGNVSGFTSSYNNGTAGAVWAYSMSEITENEYNTSGNLFWFDDDNNNLFIDSLTPTPSFNKYLNSQSIWVHSNNGSDDKAFFNVASGCTAFTSLATANGVNISPAPGSTPISPYTTGITINVTDTGWIKYDTASGTVFRFFGSLGVQDIPDCADCSTIRFAYPFADLANWVVIDCGNPC